MVDVLNPDDWEGAKRRIKDPLDIVWLNEIFHWAGDPDPLGRGFVTRCKVAAAASIADPPFRSGAGAAADFMARQFDEPQNRRIRPPAVNDYLRILRQISGARALPEWVETYPDEFTGTKVFKYRPLPENEKMGRKEFDQLAALFDQVKTEDAAEYFAKNEAEAKAVKKKLEAGELKPVDGPQLSKMALDSRADLEAQKTRVNNELRAMLTELDKAALEVLDAEKLVTGQNSEALGFSLKKAIKRVVDDIKDEFNRFERKVVRKIASPLKDFRDQVAEAILPSEVRKFGRQIENEIHRFGRRINKEFIRALENTVEAAPWIKFGAPFLGLIPGVGPILYALVVTGVAGIELAVAQRKKNEIEDALKKAREIVNAEIARLRKVADDILAKADETRAARAKLQERIRKEQAESDERIKALPRGKALVGFGLLLGGIAALGSSGR